MSPCASHDTAQALYDLSGAAATEGVTGFAPANDRGPTVERALDSVRVNPSEDAYYVEVDIQNLGGLNAELGHSRADAVYRRIGGQAQLAEVYSAADQVVERKKNP